jgi:catechol 2,3-dioxygenase-like lactoylglutathione lyase family enzyme
VTLRIDRLDHLVLTVADLDATVAFYERVLGMRHVVSGDRHALHFGRAKLNLHVAGREWDPKALRPTPGSADVCLVAAVPFDAVLAGLAGAGVAIEEGPVPREGALGPMTSVYVRDPDRNLVEISVYDDGPVGD